jgi:Zn-dependent protease with chaperone function
MIKMSPCEQKHDVVVFLLQSHNNEVTMKQRPMMFGLLLLTLLLSGVFAAAQNQVDLSKNEMPAVTIPPEAQASDHFNAEAATNAYLAEIPAASRARSDAYFEGGYWLILWDFLVAAAIYWIILHFGWSAKMRDVAEKVSRFKFVQNFLYWTQFLILTTILGFPLLVYEGYFREHKYGLATQTFGPWLVDQLKGLAIGIVLGGIAVMLLVWVVRKLPRTWHIWGTVVAILFIMFSIMIAPVYLVPMFNKVTILNDPKIVDPILSLARANGIPAHDVYEIDASKQTKRMSANVSGFGKTMRITMNDNLLKRGSQEEIESVMGHEMGHYVLNHIYKSILFLAVIIACIFAFLRWSSDRILAKYGERWKVRGFTDIAALPLVFLLGSGIFFVLTPVLNTFTRTMEAEADMYGLNASREPDGFAQAAIHLGEYRKMSPGPIEEWVFFDHPSGRNRIYAAMRWKAENLQLFKHQ